MHVSKKARILGVMMFFLVLLSGSNAADLQYKILYVESYSKAPPIVDKQYIISVDQYYTENEYRKIICAVTKDDKNTSKQNTYVEIFYRLDKWYPIYNDFTWTGKGPYPLKQVASYARRVYMESITSILHVFLDEIGNRMENSIRKYDHVVDCCTEP